MKDIKDFECFKLYEDAVNNLSSKNSGELMVAVFKYIFSGEEPTIRSRKAVSVYKSMKEADLEELKAFMLKHRQDDGNK